jgi:internalin A
MEDTVLQSRPKRRWFQFSLRTLLLITILGGILTGKVIVWVKESQEQQAIVAWIEEHDGKVGYQLDLEEFFSSTYSEIQDDVIPYKKFISVEEAKPSFWSELIASWLGNDYAYDVVRIVIENTMEDTSKLAELTELQQVEFSDLALSQLSPLADLKHVRFVRLDFVDNYDAEEIFLRDFQNLEVLLLGLGHYEHLHFLENCEQLKILELSSEVFLDEDEDYFPLRHCKKLEYLSFRKLGEVDLSFVSDMKELRWLEFADWRGNYLIEDLTPLANLEKLEHITLSSVQGISDISSVADLSHLCEIEIVGAIFKITELPDLSGMKSLEKLIISGSEISDIAGCAELENLTELSIGINYETDLTPILNLKKLKSLRIDAGSNLQEFIVAISQTNGLRELEELTIPHQELDLSSLSKLPKLAVLRLLGSGKKNNLSSISKLNNIKKLTLLRMKVNDLSALNHLSNLEVLQIYHFEIDEQLKLNGLKNLEEFETNSLICKSGLTLEYLPKLGNLYINQSEIDGAIMFSDLNSIQRLSLRKSNFRGSIILKKLPVLTSFYFDSDEYPVKLSHLDSLEELYLHGQSVKDTSHWEDLPNLKYLYLNHSDFTDLKSLNRFQTLKYLNLEGTEITDISALSKLRNLEVLNLSDTEVFDLSPLYALQNLNTLSVGGTYVDNVTDFSGLRNSEYLYLDDRACFRDNQDMLKRLLPDCRFSISEYYGTGGVNPDQRIKYICGFVKKHAY